MIRNIVFVALFSVVSLWLTFANTSSFIVTVSPDTFVEGESVDVEIRAVDEQGEVSTDFVSDIFLGIEQNASLSVDDYTLPADGYYEFASSDQWIKTFSKGLIIKKPGTYTLYVEDLYDNSVRGEASLIVTAADSDSTDDAVVVITSPANNTILDRTTTTIVGSSSSPRTPLALQLNGSLVSLDDTTDPTGGFSLSVDDLVDGENMLQVQLLDSDGAVMGSSDVVSVVVQRSEEPLFQGFSLVPSENLYVGDESQITVRVSSRVTSVSLMVDGASYPLDRSSTEAMYTWVISFNDPGTYELLVRMYVDGDMVEEDVENVTVRQKEVVDSNTSTQSWSYGVGLIRYQLDPLLPGVVDISWDADGDVSPYYLVYYGTDVSSLDHRVVVDSLAVTLDDLDLDQVTYVQVWPSNAVGDIQGDSSDPLVISFQSAAPQCVVKGITLRSQKRWSDYYLVWSPVDGAETYTVFRSHNITDTIDDMSVVWTTTKTEYQYPFDPHAAHEEYAYYAVQARCADGLDVQVWWIEKVTVGPVSSALTVMLLVAGVYFLYRVNMYQE